MKNRPFFNLFSFPFLYILFIIVVIIYLFIYRSPTHTFNRTSNVNIPTVKRYPLARGQRVAEVWRSD